MTKKIIILVVVTVTTAAFFFSRMVREPHGPTYGMYPRVVEESKKSREASDDMLGLFLGGVGGKKPPESSIKLPDPFKTGLERKLGAISDSVRKEEQEGPVRSYYESGAVREEAYFSDGVPHGSAKWYYESGELEQEVNFNLGKRQGAMRTYYENGGIKEEVVYNNNLAEGTAKWFYETGVLSQEAEYSAGKREGVTKVYNEDGTLKGEWEYKDDVPVKRPEVYRIGIVK